ncbi:MAG: beta-glucosidase BglX [Mariniphaga sp.]|nr:beta-glucosidase BglX [Mariniphaga sp.]
MKQVLGILIVSAVVLVSCKQDGSTQLKSGTNLNPEIEQKIDNLLAQMTLDEKIGQLNQYTSRWEMTGPAPDNIDSVAFYNLLKEGKIGSMLNVTGAITTRRVQQYAVDSSRLGIPIILGYDVIHGFKTMFPIPLAEAASWDPEVAKLSSRIAAIEASAAGLHWTFAPMVDIARDARWGRVMEGSGEDPFLGAKMAYARVKGFQGEDLAEENTIAACTKHFAAYGFAEAGRDYNTVDIGERTLHNMVLPPFKATVDAGVATFMNSFNILNGVPATADSYLQRDILKGEWGFDGFVVSDWNSIGELIPHGLAANREEAAKLAITAGSDMDMEGNCYLLGLKSQVEKGEVDEVLVDDAVRRVLRIKFRLGLFDDPFQYCDAEREMEVTLSESHLNSAREVAKKSIVLLKNENSILPLKKSGQKIAVIGDLAGSKDVPLGSWRAQAVSNSAVSLVEGIASAVSNVSSLYYEKGPLYVKNQRTFATHLQFNETDKSGINQAVDAARKSDVVVIALGEDCFQTGEGRSQVDIGLKGLQQELLEEVYKVNKNVVVVLMNGRPLEINWMAENVPAIVEAWHLGSEAGNAIADVLFGDYNPAGKLPVSFPRSVGQAPIYYNYMNTGRPTGGDAVFWSHYTDEQNTPLFPFGYGLSYTTFEYSEFRLSSENLTMGGELKVSAIIKNTGEVAGEEVVQLYIRDLVGSISRPVKELKGFEKIMLEPGESKEVSFTITTKDLEFYGINNRWEAEPGDFKLWVGTNSSEGLEGEFELK